MTRRFLALLVTAVLAAGAASAQSQSWGPYPASDVKAFLEKEPQYRKAFILDAKGGAMCTDAAAAKVFEVSRNRPTDSPVLIDAAEPTGTVAMDAAAQPVRLEPGTSKSGTLHTAASRQRMAEIEEELKNNPANAKALIVEREQLLKSLKRRAPDAR